MNKLTKIMLGIVASLSVLTASAVAGEFTVTGSAKTTYAIRSSDSANAALNSPQGLGIANEFSLGASGELDNGYTWTYAQDIDGATVQDDANIAVTTPMGVVKVCISECGLGSEFAWDTSAYGTGSDNGLAGTSAATTAAGDNATTYQNGTNISSYNNVQYHTPADMLPFGISFKIGYAPEGDGTINSSNAAATQSENANSVTQYKVSMAPIDGLSLAASYLEKDDAFADSTATTQGYESGSWGATYAFGPATVGYGKTWIAPTIGAQTAGTARVIDYENTAYGIGIAANENLTVSYTVESSDENNKNETATNTTVRSTTEFEITTAQAAYTMGGVTISLSHKELENMDYTDDNDANEFILAMNFAF
jgi:hypothetical protein